MQAFKTFNGVVMPLDRTNVDTDAITPARFLKSIKRTGFARALFGNWRYVEKADGVPNPDFVLNQPRYQGVTILLTRENFGCGSSREHAPWALQEYGFKVILAPDFADIFYSNCFNIGLLPITLKQSEISQLFEEVENEPLYRLKVSLAENSVTTPAGIVYKFEIDAFKRDALLKGLDNIGWTLEHETMISGYEQAHKDEQPWLYVQR